VINQPLSDLALEMINERWAIRVCYRPFGMRRLSISSIHPALSRQHETKHLQLLGIAPVHAATI